MTVLAFVILAAVALAACGFVAWPILRRGEARGRYVLGAAAVLFVLGIGGGLYVGFGHPALAVRTMQGANAADLNAAIGRWSEKARANPGDPRGWALLGEAYITARDPQDAAKAFERSIAAAEAHGQHFSFLYSAYGESLTQASAGAVPPEAETAFGEALALDPKDNAARYFLGLAAASQRNYPQALAYWTSLIADVPANSPLHEDLVDRIAGVRAQMGGAPDVGAMVARLAAELKAKPDNAPGWQRLINAYAVLGDKDKARAALAEARKAMAGHGDQLAVLDAEARQLGL